MKNGFFIALEGSEACGKTTQLTLLFNQIRHMPYDVGITYTAEPSALVRSLVTRPDITDMTRLLLIAAGRADTHRKHIKPALERGDVCLTDRYLLSTLVYQHEDNEFAWLAHYYAAENLHPDLTIVLDVPPEVAQKRLQKRGELDVLEDVPLAELKRRNDRFVEIASAMPDMVVVDGNRRTHEVHGNIWGIVKPLLEPFVK